MLKASNSQFINHSTTIQLLIENCFSNIIIIFLLKVKIIIIKTVLNTSKIKKKINKIKQTKLPLKD